MPINSSPASANCFAPDRDRRIASDGESNGNRSRDAADGRVDRRGDDHPLAGEGRREGRARPAAVRDLDRQGRCRDSEPGGRRAARDPQPGGRDRAGEPGGRDDRRSRFRRRQPLRPPRRRRPSPHRRLRRSRLPSPQRPRPLRPPLSPPHPPRPLPLSFRLQPRQPLPARSRSASASCRARWCAASPPRRASTSPS